MNTRTNIVLDDVLVAKAMARAGVSTKKAAVEAALRAFVRKPDYSGLLALAGEGVIAEDYDPKALFDPPGPAGGQRRSPVKAPRPPKSKVKVAAGKPPGKPTRRPA